MLCSALWPLCRGPELRPTPEFHLGPVSEDLKAEPWAMSGVMCWMGLTRFDLKGLTHGPTIQPSNHFVSPFDLEGLAGLTSLKKFDTTIRPFVLIHSSHAQIHMGHKLVSMCSSPVTPRWRLLSNEQENAELAGIQKPLEVRWFGPESRNGRK